MSDGAAQDPRILLTGASGFIGSEVLARLLKRVPPARITVLGRRKPDFEKGLFAERMAEHGAAAAAQGVEFVETDFMESERLRSDLARLARRGEKWVVVHLAAVIHNMGDAAAADRMNVGVTRELLEWANQHGHHFIFTSSMVAFGGTRKPVIRSERDFANFPPESLRFDYYRTKRAAHLDVWERATVPLTVLCPSIVHGSLENYKSSRSHLRALREGTLKVAPPGGVNLVSLDHVAESIVQAALEETPQGKRTRLLVDRNLPMRDYFATYVSHARGAGGQRIRVVPPWVGRLSLLAFGVMNKFGWYSALVEGLAQGSLYLYFRSEFSQPHSRGIDAAIRASLRPAETRRLAEF